MSTSDQYKLNVNVHGIVVHGGTDDVTALDTAFPDADVDMVLSVVDLFTSRLMRDMGDDIISITSTLNTYDQSVTLSVALHSLTPKKDKAYMELCKERVGAEVSFILLSVIHELLMMVEDQNV